MWEGGDSSRAEPSPLLSFSLCWLCSSRMSPNLSFTGVVKLIRPPSLISVSTLFYFLSGLREPEIGDLLDPEPRDYLRLDYGRTIVLDLPDYFLPFFFFTFLVLAAAYLRSSRSFLATFTWQYENQPLRIVFAAYFSRFSFMSSKKLKCFCIR